MKAIVMRYESEITEGLRFHTVEPTMFPWCIVFGTLEIAKHKSTDIFGRTKTHWVLLLPSTLLNRVYLELKA